jgi:hypothetical protein
MTPEEAASDVARQIRAGGLGFLTMTKEELRTRFHIGRLTANLSNEVVEALGAVDLVCVPHPFEAGQNVRVYDRRHDLGAMASAVASPDSSTDYPLRKMAETIAREKAGRDLRSDDVPWLEALGMLLQLVLGREPDGWEDLRNDRHSLGLARELAASLNIDPNVVEHPALTRLASATCTFRPAGRRYRAEELALDSDGAVYASTVVQAIEANEKKMFEQRNALLRAAAKLVLRGAEPPNEQVEVGVLGLRRRRELGV